MQLATFFKRIITYSFYLLFFLTPLILTTSNFELFEFPKMLFVYAMTVIIAGAWVSLWIVQKKITIRQTPFDYFFLFFLLTQVLSTVFSIHPYTSIFGYYSRFHGGLLSTICYLVLFYAFVSNSKPTSSPRCQGKITSQVSYSRHLGSLTLNCLFLLLASAALSSLYAVAEHFGIDSTYWVQDVQNRVFSTLGQPNWLAAFLTALIPFTLVLAIKPPKSKYPTGISLLLLNTTAAYGLTRLVSGKVLPTTLPSIIFFLILFAGGLFLINYFWEKVHSRWPLGLNFYLLFTLFVTTVLFTKSRSGILAMVVSFGVFWILSLATSIRKLPAASYQSPKNWKLETGSWKLLIKHFFAFSFLLLALFALIGTEWTPALRELPATGFQLPAITEKKLETGNWQLETPKYAPHISESTDIRKVVWEGAVKVFQNYPLAGSGVETFAYSFYNFRPRSHNDLSEWDFLYNKAHNEYLNYLATTGIPGTTAIFSIILMFFYLNLLPLISGKDRPWRTPRTVLAIAFISPAILTYFLKPSIFATLINKLVIYPPLLRPLGIALGLTIIFTTLVIKFSEHQPLTASWQLAAGSYAAMAAIIITNFYGFSVVTIGLLFFVLLPAITIVPSRQPPAASQKEKLGTGSWGLEAKEYLCLSLVCLISLIFLWRTINYYRADWFFTRGKNLAQANQMVKGIKTLEKAVKLRPKEALYHSELGEIYAIASLSLHIQDATGSAQSIKEFSQKASGQAETTLKLNPVHINFYKSVTKIYLTLAQIEPNFYQKAIETLERAWQLSLTDPKLPYNLGIIAKALGENEKAEAFFEKTVELRPAYRKAWLDLGEVRTELGKKEKAAEAYQFILDNIDPEDELANKLLGQINL